MTENSAAQNGETPSTPASPKIGTERAASSPIAPIETTQFPSSTLAADGVAKRRGIGTGGIVTIVAGSVIVLGLMVWALISLMSSFFGVVGDVVSGLPEEIVGTDDSGVERLMAGQPGSPYAQQPLECDGPCFVEDDVAATVLDDSVFDTLGIAVSGEGWTPSSSARADDVFRYAKEDWVTYEGAPDSCFVTYPFGPVSYAYGSDENVPADPIHETVYKTDKKEYSMVQQSVRVFESTIAASTHMSTVATSVEGCANYQIGLGADLWSADVTAPPALDVPDSVAAVGWVENGRYYRYFSFDIQRGNLVVRTLIGTDTVSEKRVRDFMENVAENLSTLEPSGTVVT